MYFVKLDKPWVFLPVSSATVQLLFPLKGMDKYL